MTDEPVSAPAAAPITEEARLESWKLCWNAAIPITKEGKVVEWDNVTGLAMIVGEQTVVDGALCIVRYETPIPIPVPKTP